LVAKDRAKATQLARYVGRITSDIPTEAGERQAALAAARNRAEATETGYNEPLTDLVVTLVRELTMANSETHVRLASAESELQKQHLEIESHLSNSLTDPLTGLPNRRALEQCLATRLAGWEKHRIPFSLLLLDVDHFKSVNDAYGHTAGDRVLCTVASSLRQALRGPDVVVRYGGEEFAVLLPYTAMPNAQNAASKILDAIASATTEFEGQVIRVTASVGVSDIRNGDDGGELLKRADTALYASKEGRRACGHYHNGISCERFDAAVAKEIAERQSDSTELIAAVGGPPDERLGL
jgi:diguanylate cyclase